MRGSIPTLVIATALIGGCSKHDEKPAGVLPEYQRQALEKAQNVETVIGEGEARRREELLIVN